MKPAVFLISVAGGGLPIERAHIGDSNPSVISRPGVQIGLRSRIEVVGHQRELVAELIGIAFFQLSLREAVTLTTRWEASTTARSICSARSSMIEVLDKS